MPDVFKVFIGRDEGDLEDLLSRSLKWLDWCGSIKNRATIFIKPNFTWPKYIPGVTTSPRLLEALFKVLRMQLEPGRIILGESDGGRRSFAAEEAFAGHGMYELCRANGVELVNLSKGPSKLVSIEVAGRLTMVELPLLLLEEVDTFITVPVLKTHIMTGVSLGLKNQWGCIPDAMRLLQHPILDRGIVAINKILRPGLSIIDGLVAQDGNGPLYGEPVRMNLIIASDNVFAGDRVACELMQVNPGRIMHQVIASKDGLMPARGDILLNTDLETFQSRRFLVKRKPINWVVIMVAKTRFTSKLLYDSPLTGPVYKLRDWWRSARRNLRRSGETTS
ncbi:MAG: DUF362 domain-containing protein [Firmicutes bacterium]|nr:DUF362 domain-containing protein [Bacillota bacterium]